MLVNLSPKSIIPSLLKSNPSPHPHVKSSSHLSKSWVKSLGSSGSKYKQSQALVNGLIDPTPPFVHIYISYPSGKPSPSVSATLGSKYSLRPEIESSGDLPVNEFLFSESKHASKVNGQQYSISAVAPSLSRSVTLSVALYESRP